MPKTAQRKDDAALYLRRLIEDEQVQNQLADAAAKLRKAYERAERTKKGAKAAEDKKLYAHVREAAGSLRGAVIALRKPPPKPKRRGRTVAIVGVALVGAGLVAKRVAGGPEEELDYSGNGSPVA
jgi:predicted RNA-binding Zn ribbon-like protein